MNRWLVTPNKEFVDDLSTTDRCAGPAAQREGIDFDDSITIGRPSRRMSILLRWRAASSGCGEWKPMHRQADGWPTKIPDWPWPSPARPEAARR